MEAPDWTRSFRCHIDAGQIAVGGKLTETSKNGDEYLISFFSKRLSPGEKNYSANHYELLGLMYYLQCFHSYLEGSQFDIFYRYLGL